MDLRLLILVFLISCISCSKDCPDPNDPGTPPVNELQQKLILKGKYEAIKFIVDGESVLAPDTSEILGGPLSYLKFNFLANDSLEMTSEIYRLGAYEASGLMFVKWTIDATEKKINMIDNNLWTSKFFTGIHDISIDGQSHLHISGKLNILDYPFELELK